MIPIILLCGEAGSGKDTIAGFLAKNHKCQPIAFADPMKRFAMKAFGFTEDQLWGPSEARNAVDARFASHKECNAVLDSLEGPALTELHTGGPAVRRLEAWAFRLLKTAQQEGGLTPRKMLQTLGTEWGRRENPNMWIDRAIWTAKQILYHGAEYSRTRGLMLYGPAPEFVVISDGRFRNEILKVRELGAQVWKIRSSSTPTMSSAGVANHVSEVEQRSIPNFYFTATLNNDKSYGLGAAEGMVRQAMAQLTDRELKPEWYSTKWP